MIAPYFQGFKNLILSDLKEAKHSIKIAVAWFTDKDVFNILIQKRKEGLSIILVLSNDELNFNQAYSLNFESFKAIGGLLVTLQAVFMHHKFCIIDEAVLLMGSVNYTKNGFFNNKESLFRITDEPKTIKDFLAEFESLLDGLVLDQGIIVSPEKQRLVSEITFLNKQITWLEISISETEKQIYNYELQYSLRFQELLEHILLLKKQIAEKQWQLTQKVEEKEAATYAHETYQEFKTSVNEHKKQAVKLSDSSLQKEILQLFREGVKLCHPDNPTVKDKKQANAIFDRLKKAYEINDLENVKLLVSDLKSGLAFTQDFTDVAIDKLKELLTRLEEKCKSLINTLESLSKDQRFLIIQQDSDAIATHFEQEEKQLNLVKEQLKNKLDDL